MGPLIHHISAVIDRLRRECQKAGGQAKWARQHDFSRSFVNDVLAGRKGVTDRMAAELGFRRVVTWKDLRDTGRIPRPPQLLNEKE